VDWVGLNQSWGCVVLKTGELECWGEPENPQYGQLNPPQGADFTQVYASYSLGLALDSTGAVTRWGLSQFIGDNDGLYSEVVPIGIYTACGLEQGTGVLNCWGGHEHLFTLQGTSLTTISAGSQYRVHICGIQASDGSIACDGDLSSDTLSPVPEGAFLDVDCGIDHCCAIEASSREISC
jgi:hypothetical protein